MKLLITGFDPFNKETINPSYEAVKLLPSKIGKYDVIKMELPTKYVEAPKLLLKKIDEINPDLIICCGQAGGRAKISLEKIAVNFMSASIADNAGVFKKDEKILLDKDDAISTSIDVIELVNTLNKEEDVYQVSYSAGTFVCNNVYFELLNKKKDSLFIHVPFIPLQTRENKMPSMELMDITSAIEKVIELI